MARTPRVLVCLLVLTACDNNGGTQPQGPLVGVWTAIGENLLLGNPGPPDTLRVTIVRDAIDRVEGTFTLRSYGSGSQVVWFGAFDDGARVAGELRVPLRPAESSEWQSIIAVFQMAPHRLQGTMHTVYDLGPTVTRGITLTR